MFWKYKVFPKLRKTKSFSFVSKMFLTFFTAPALLMMVYGEWTLLIIFTIVLGWLVAGQNEK